MKLNSDSCRNLICWKLGQHSYSCLVSEMDTIFKRVHKIHVDQFLRMFYMFNFQTQITLAKCPWFAHLDLALILASVLAQGHGIFVFACGLFKPRLKGLLVPVHLRLHLLQLLRLPEDVVLQPHKILVSSRTKFVLQPNKAILVLHPNKIILVLEPTKQIQILPY